MFISPVFLSLVTAWFAQSCTALSIRVEDQESVKSTAQKIASSIVAEYQNDLQNDRIPGLFSDPYYWWETGAVFGSLVDYSYLTGDTQYNKLLAEGFEHQLGMDDSFMPTNQSRSLSNDDQSTWGLAAMSAAETGFTPTTIANVTWLTLASNVFNTQVARWNEKTCKGGLNWQIYQFNNGFTYKNSMSNGNFFLLAARLAKFTGNTTYSEWAEKSFDWAQEIGLIDEYLVYDGSDETGDCTDINKIQWVSNIGIYTEGAAHMWNITNGDDKWKKAVSGFINTTLSDFAKNDTLTEPACEPSGKCSIDQRANKGLAARSFARAIRSAPFASELLTPVLETSAEAAADNCHQKRKGRRFYCTLRWDSTDDSTNGLGESFSALAVVQALLLPNATASMNGSDSSGSSNGTSTGNAPAASGSGQPVTQDGAADSLIVSYSSMMAIVGLVVAFL